MKRIYIKFSIVLLVIMTVLLALPTYTKAYNSYQPQSTSSYSSYDYIINSYNIDIKVNENNTFDVTETIGTYFNVPKHGIYRTIPLNNEVKRLDGTTSENTAKISKLKVSDNYSISKVYKSYNDTLTKQYVIKIGSANKTITGEKIYTISYNYNIGKDPNEEYDELYYNIIGDEWDTIIRNVSFTITMPKEFDETKLGFSAGKTGSIDSSKIIYEVNGNVITGSYNGVLNPGEALTVRTELPEGYFVDTGYQLSITNFLLFIVPIICLTMSIFIWYKFGKDNQVVETVEFYPPDGLNSLEVGFYYKGKATDKDVTSLLVYLANKGYIKITEKEQKSFYGKSNSFEITKLKEYDGNDKNEREFLEGLFKKKESISDLSSFTKNGQVNNNKIDSNPKQLKVTQSDLYDNFYITVNKILQNMNSKTRKKKIFDTKTTSKTGKIIIVMMAIAIMTMNAIPALEYGGLKQFINALFMTLLIIPLYIVGLKENTFKVFNIVWLGFVMLFATVIPGIIQIAGDPLLLIGFLLGIVCLIGMIICFKAMPKRTKYGTEILGKIRGFKTFLESAEKEKLEAMVEQDPDYFYNILPYTYVLGVSDKWISKFETINLKAPEWYIGSSEFNTSNFGSFMNNTMSSAQKAMTSSPSGTSGGSSSGSSGGGSSGGGSGGGGGGSW